MLDQMPKERILGVVLNRTDEQLDSRLTITSTAITIVNEDTGK